MKTNEPLRVTAIGVKGLFGVYDHHVALNSEDRITIIHGPNGVGKTAFLRLTHSLISGKYGQLAKTIFDDFFVKFSDGSMGGVRRSHIANNSDAFLTSVYFIPSNGQKVELSVSAETLDPERIADRIEKESPYLLRAGPQQWIDRRNDEILSAHEVVTRYSELLPEKIRNKLLKDLPQLKAMRERVNVHFIETQRLIRLGNVSTDWRYGPGRDKSIVETVQECSRDLKKRIADTLGLYAKESQRLDQTFPQRLLSSSGNGKSLDQLKIDFLKIEQKRGNLTTIDLIVDSAETTYPFNPSSLEALDSTQQTVLSLYVEDTATKLGVLEDLAQRVQILLDNINKKFKNKQISIERDNGLIVIGPNKIEKLSLSALSSGEQHEIVLMYDLLFKVSKNTLVLLDEPELSLHVSWQKSFLDDLAPIIKIAEFDALIATHSPFIVGDRSDLMVALSSDAVVDQK